MLLHQETFAVLNVGNRICGNLLADFTGIGSFEILLGIEPGFRNVIEGNTGLASTRLKQSRRSPGSCRASGV